MTANQPTLGWGEGSWFRGATAALLATLVCAAPILYVHRESPRTLVSAHGLLHTAIAQRFATTSLGNAPPENPFFAAAPVPYYWFFQYCGERLAHALGVHPLHVFEWMILAAACAVWAASVVLGQRLYAGVLSGLAVGLLVFGGTNPFGLAILLGKMLLRGSAPLQDDPNHLWGITHPVFSAARLNDPSGLYGPPINFFFNITARPLGLAMVLVVALALLSWLQRPSVAAWLGLTLSTALCTAFSFVMGAPTALALSAALVLAAQLPNTLDQLGEDELQRWRRRALGAAAALLFGVTLSAPTFTHFFLGEAERGLQLDVSFSALVRLVASGGLILGLAVLGTLRQRYNHGRFLCALFMAAAALVSAGIFLRLPVENQCNFFQAGAVLLALPAVGACAPVPGCSAKRIALTWLSVVLVFLPTVLLVMVAYLHRPPIALAFTHGTLERIPAESPLARLYSWVRQSTPANAVFILDPGPPFTTAVGNVPEFPALTSRVMFTSYRRSYMVAPHRDASRRHEIAKRLVAGEALNAEQAVYLTALQRPLYLVVESADGSEAPSSVCQRYGNAVFHDRSVVACAIDPASTAAGREPRTIPADVG